MTLSSKSLGICFLFLLNSSLLAAQQINFLDANWEALLAKAQEENKMIFVDTYTDWCTYCKVMDKEVFTQKKVATYFNENFINYKIDAERGEGPMLALKYYLKEFPTFLFVNPDGALIYKTTGFLEGAPFIAEARRAKSYREKNELEELKTEYASKKDDKAFLKKYVRTMDEHLKMVESDLLDDYISVLSEKELLKESNIELLIFNTKYADTKAFDFILEHYDDFTEVYPKTAFLLDNAIFNSLELAAKNKDTDLLEKLKGKNRTFIQTTMELYDIETASLDRLAEKMDLLYYKKAQQKEAYATLATRYVEAYALNKEKDDLIQTEMASMKAINESALTERKLKTRKIEKLALTYANQGAAIALSNIADTYADLFDDEEHLQQAQGWIEEAIKMREQPEQYLAYAKIQYKLGDKTKAKDLAQKGLSLSEQINANKFTSYQLKKLDELEKFLNEMD